MDQPKQKRVWINQDVIDSQHCMYYSLTSCWNYLTYTLDRYFKNLVYIMSWFYTYTIPIPSKLAMKLQKSHFYWSWILFHVIALFMYYPYLNMLSRLSHQTQILHSLLDQGSRNWRGQGGAITLFHFGMGGWLPCQIPNVPLPTVLANGVKVVV